MDRHFAALLARDPGAVLLFFQGFSRGSTQAFADRLQRAFAAQGLAPRGQVKFLPRLPGDGFRRVLAACDVVLDTFGWSGGNTTLDALAAGTPVVTVPGRFMRGRQTAAMLRIVGLGSLVADSAEAWVADSHAIAHDAARVAELRAAITAGRGALFDRPEPVAAYQDTLLRLALEAAI
jgi:predicted O-linked N-acetylglucosamine transferase (SPINDLY family)